MVTTPTDSGVNRLIVYGTLDIGEVPRSAAIENATPRAIIHRPMTRTAIRKTKCSFLICVLF